MEKNRHNSASASALPAIARHEKALLEQERASAAEAKQILDKARADAFSIHEECGRSIATDVAAIRRDGEQARENERQRYLEAFEAKLQSMREDAKKRSQVAIDAVVALVVPKGAR